MLEYANTWAVQRKVSQVVDILNISNTPIWNFMVYMPHPLNVKLSSCSDKTAAPVSFTLISEAAARVSKSY